MTGLPNLQRQLNLRAFFGDSDFCPAKSKCYIRSSWQPPYDGQVSSAMRNLHTRMLEYEPRTYKNNVDWLDARAKKWLATHSLDFAVIDCEQKMLALRWRRDLGIITKYKFSLKQDSAKLQPSCIKILWLSSERNYRAFFKTLYRTSTKPMQTFLGATCPLMLLLLGPSE